MKKITKYKLNRNLFSCYSCKIVEFKNGEYIKVEDLSKKMEDLLFNMSQCKNVQECIDLLASFIDKDKHV